MGHAPVSAKNVHGFFEAVNKPILQDMPIVRDMLGFDIIARLPGLDGIFYSPEFEAFRAQVLPRHREYQGMNLETMEGLNTMVRVLLNIWHF